MLFRKNKARKHCCSICGFKELNIYYGVKSYDDIPLYPIDFYVLQKSRCMWCHNEFYYLIEK
jgi:hypothetical protein